MAHSQILHFLHTWSGHMTHIAISSWNINLKNKREKSQQKLKTMAFLSHALFLLWTPIGTKIWLSRFWKNIYILQYSQNMFDGFGTSVVEGCVYFSFHPKWSTLERNTHSCIKCPSTVLKSCRGADRVFWSRLKY